MSIEMKLPELGENIEGGDVLRVMVKPGDAIKKDQPVLELETDKATIEVPSSVDGVVKETSVKAGEKIKVGQTIFVVDAGAGEKVEAATPKPAAEPSPTRAAAAAKAPAATEVPRTAPQAVSKSAAPAPGPAAPSPERRSAQVVDITR